MAHIYLALKNWNKKERKKSCTFLTRTSNRLKAWGKGHTLRRLFNVTHLWGSKASRLKSKEPCASGVPLITMNVPSLIITFDSSKNTNCHRNFYFSQIFSKNSKKALSLPHFNDSNHSKWHRGTFTLIKFSVKTTWRHEALSTWSQPLNNRIFLWEEGNDSTMESAREDILFLKLRMITSLRPKGLIQRQEGGRICT